MANILRQYYETNFWAFSCCFFTHYDSNCTVKFAAKHLIGNNSTLSWANTCYYLQPRWRNPLIHAEIKKLIHVSKRGPWPQWAIWATCHNIFSLIIPCINIVRNNSLTSYLRSCICMGTSPWGNQRQNLKEHSLSQPATLVLCIP